MVLKEHYFTTSTAGNPVGTSAGNPAGTSAGNPAGTSSPVFLFLSICLISIPAIRWYIDFLAKVKSIVSKDKVYIDNLIKYPAYSI